MISKGKSGRSAQSLLTDADIVAQVHPRPVSESDDSGDKIAGQIVRRHAQQLREALSKLTLHA